MAANGARAKAERKLDNIQVLRMAADAMHLFMRIQRESDEVTVRAALSLLRTSNPQLFDWLRAALAPKEPEGQPEGQQVK